MAHDKNPAFNMQDCIQKYLVGRLRDFHLFRLSVTNLSTHALCFLSPTQLLHSSVLKWHISATGTHTVLLSVHLYAPSIMFPVPYNYIGI